MNDQCKVISIGYSGYPERINYKAFNDKDRSYYAGDPYSMLNCLISVISSFIHVVCHAEYDAILSKGTPSVKGCTLYVTKYPYNDCTKVIVQSGIKKVVFAKGKPKDDDRPHTVDDILNETDPTKMKQDNMYLSSVKILKKCSVPDQKIEENIKVFLHDHDPSMIILLHKLINNLIANNL